MTKPIQAGASRFAHLAAEDDKKPADKKDDKDMTKSAAADEDKKDDDKKDEKDKDAKAKKASTDEDVEEVEDDLDDLEERVEELEDAEDDEDKRDEKVASAARVSKLVTASRAAERARCAEIFTSKAAAGNSALAASLAFETDMKPAAAAKIMSAAGVGPARATTRRSLNTRMEGAPTVSVGTGNAPSAAADSPEALAANVMAAYSAAHGRPAKK